MGPLSSPMGGERRVAKPMKGIGVEARQIAAARSVQTKPFGTDKGTKAVPFGAAVLAYLVV